MQVVSKLRSFPDHRPGQGVRYPLYSIILLVLFGFLSGRDSLAGVSRFANKLTKPQLKRLGFRHGRAPCHAAICNAFHGINSDALAQIFGAIILQDKGKEPIHLSIDGKALCGSKKRGEKGVHILHAFANKLGGVVDQVMVSSKTNEAKAMLDLLDKLELDNTIITGDAMFCQKEITNKITRNGGDYMITVKDNQKDLHRKMDAAFESEMINKAEGEKNN